jgi:predicted methyltransferase MtxX (methanogen marker protein 4)
MGYRKLCPARAEKIQEMISEQPVGTQYLRNTSVEYSWYTIPFGEDGNYGRNKQVDRN